MAIEDGAVLARCLKDVSETSEALNLYQRNRYDRTKKVVETSNANRKLFHLDNEAEIRAYFSDRDEGASRNDWLYSYNPLTTVLK